MNNFKSGFVALVGRPNTGKSTLINELVGADIAITAKQVQTTRHVIRGIITDKGHQLILVDTPGFHKPKTLLGERLSDLVKQTISDVDLIVFCIAADEKIGAGDRFLLNQVKSIINSKKIVGVITKIDKIKKDNLIKVLQDVAIFLGPDSDLIPVSSFENDNIDRLISFLKNKLPNGPMLYDQNEVTDEKTEKILSEYIRESAIKLLKDEIPHSVTVVIDELVKEENGFRKIYSTIVVERDSQKAIVIGKKGEKLKKIGEYARKNIENMFDEKVFLSIHVKVEKNWQQNSKLLEKLGF